MDGRICVKIEKCLYTKQLQEKIDATSNLREKLKLQVQFLDSIEELICGDGSNKVCCDPGITHSMHENRTPLLRHCNNH